MTSVSDIRRVSQGVEYRNQPKVQIEYILSDPSISDGAYRLWTKIHTDAFFDDEFSITQPKKALAKALNTSVSSINRRLKELEVAGYINVVAQRKSNECLPSKISVDLPEPLVELLKAAPVRKRSVIKKCGTVDKNPALEENKGKDIGTSTSEGSPPSSVRSRPYRYNNHENNNNKDRDLASDEAQKNSESNSSVVVFSDDDQLLASEASSSEPIEISVLSTELSELDSQINSLSKLLGFERDTSRQEQVSALETELVELQDKRSSLQASIRNTKEEGAQCSDSMGDEKEKGESVDPLARNDSSNAFSFSSQGVNLFAEAEEAESVDVGKEAEKKDLRQKIEVLDLKISKLSSMEGAGDDNTSEHEALIRLREVESERFNLAKRLEVLSKQLKPVSMQLEHGDRKLTGDDLQKIKGVLGAAVNAKKISVCDARQTLKSMVQSILHGYYASEGVCIAKSVNSVIKKFKHSEWSNSIDQDNKPSRSQPPLWERSSSNRIDFSGIVKNINSKNVVARRLN